MSGVMRSTAAMVALVLAQSASTARADPVSACLDSGGDIGAVMAALGEEGWRAVPLGAPLPEAVADRLVWPFAAVYLAGDTGGATPGEVLALQRRALEGLSRKRDRPGSRTRLMARGEGAAMDVLLATAVQVTPHLAEIRCSAALTDPASATPGVPGGIAAAPPVRRSGDGGGFRAIFSATLDPDALAARVGTPVPVTAVVETTLRYPNEVPQ